MKHGEIGLTILMLFLVGGLHLIGSGKAFDKAEQIQEVMAELEAEGMSQDALEAYVGQEIPSSRRLTAGGFLALLSTLVGFVTIVLLFVKRQIAPHAALVFVITTGLTIAIYPAVEMGMLEGASPRTLSITALVLAGVGAFSAYLAARRS